MNLPEMNLPHKIEDVERDILNLLGDNFTPVIFGGRKGYYLKHPVIRQGVSEYSTAVFPRIKINNKKTSLWMYTGPHVEESFKKLIPWLSNNRANDFHDFLEFLCDRNKKDNDQNIETMFTPEVLHLIDIWKNDSL